MEFKSKGFFEYVVPPLEGFWWQDDVEGVYYANKSTFNWISVIRLPDFVSKEDFEWAVETAAKKWRYNYKTDEFNGIRARGIIKILEIRNKSERFGKPSDSRKMQYKQGNCPGNPFCI